MKKALAVAIFSVLVLCLMAGCTSSEKSGHTSFYERGLSLIALSRELVSDEAYLSYFGIYSEEQKAILRDLASMDVSDPRMVFSLDISEQAFGTLFGDGEKLSEKVKSYLADSAMSSISGMINTRMGTHFAVAATVSGAQMTFDHAGVRPPVMYLYMFENGYAYAVVFIPGYDNSVRANAAPLLDDDLSGCETAHDLVQYFSDTLHLAVDKACVSVVRP